NPSEVAGTGLQVEFLEQAVVARVGLEFGHAAFGIVDVTEHDRLAGASLTAGRRDGSVRDRFATVVLGFDAGLLDALHAIRALFHDAAEPDGHVRVHAHLFGFGVLVVVVEEVETPHLEGAVVGAVARADAPVVHHVVEAVVRVHGGADGADFFAGCVFALLAAQRLKLQLRVFDIAGEVAVKAKPVHFTTAQDLLLAHGGNVVFGLTGDHARVATRAAVQVDDHAPLHALGEVVRAAHGLVPQAF